MTIPHMHPCHRSIPPLRIGFLRPWILRDVRWCFQVRIWKEVNFKRWKGTTTTTATTTTNNKIQKFPTFYSLRFRKKQVQQEPQDHWGSYPCSASVLIHAQNKTKQQITSDNNNLQLLFTLSANDRCDNRVQMLILGLTIKYDVKVSNATRSLVYIEFPGVSKKACKWLYNIFYVF